MNNELANLTATELIALYASGEATPTQATEACLSRIAAIDDKLNAVLLLLGDRARAQAAESDARWKAGTARSLEGVPYGLKDIVATAGIETTGGSSLFIGNVPEKDAAIAGRLADAGEYCSRSYRPSSSPVAAPTTAPSGSPATPGISTGRQAVLRQAPARRSPGARCRSQSVPTPADPSESPLPLRNHRVEGHTWQGAS